MVKIVKFLVCIISEYLSKSKIPDVSNWNCWTLFGWKIEVGIGIGGRAHWPHAPPTHSGYAPVIRWTSILLVSLNNWIKNLEDINYYHNHISIEKIKSSNNNIQTLFTFNLASSDEIKRYILTLNNKKASREGDITVNIVKAVTDNYLPILTKVIKSSTEQNEFPNELKMANFLTIYKNAPLNRENYRPVSLLSHMPKVFERLLYKQVEAFTSNKRVIFCHKVALDV